MLHHTTMQTPIGELVLTASDTGLREIRLPLPERRAVVATVATVATVAATGHPVLVAACSQLDEYFRGERQTFDVALDVEGSSFQREVWQALAEIPYGATESYGQLAERIGKPGAARAVGGANGRNPIPIIVPCHRVIGASGALTGYGGPTDDGIAMKRWLIRHETSVAAVAVGAGVGENVDS